MEFLELIKKRYSCRHISSIPIEKDKLEKIVIAGQMAPSACNKQPVKIWVIQSEAGKQKVCETTNDTFGAGTFIVVGGRKDQGWIREYDARKFADVDAAIAATQMMLEIEELGLATTWVGHFDNRKMKKLFPSMAGYDLIALFPVGYSAENAKASDLHKQRKTIEEITEWL